MKKRLLILDPTCYYSYGHNFDANAIFSDSFTSFGVDTSINICKNSLVAKMEKHPKFDSTLDHVYSLNTQCENERQKISDQSIYAALDSASEAQNVFFPNADYYTIVSIFSYLNGIGKNRTKPLKVFIRLIGLLEFKGASPSEVLDPFTILKDNTDFFKNGSCYLFAETKKYSDFLTEHLGFEVNCVPYGFRSIRHPLKCSQSGPVTLGTIGQARAEKGYFNLFQLISSLNELCADGSYSYLIQRMDISNPEYDKKYENLLDSLKNVKSLPCNLSSIQLEAYVQSCDALVLPYDRQAYEYRGSAMFFDGISYNKALFSFDELGFSTEIREFNLGKTVSSDLRNLAEVLADYIENPETVDTGAFNKFQENSIKTIVSMLA